MAGSGAQRAFSRGDARVSNAPIAEVGRVFRWGPIRAQNGRSRSVRRFSKADVKVARRFWRLWVHFRRANANASSENNKA